MRLQTELAEWQRNGVTYYDALFGVAEWTDSVGARSAVTTAGVANASAITDDESA
jgi:hypothetical protein